MAHEIDMTNARANVAFRGETPWHGLGFPIEANDDIETIKTKAGLNWTLKEHQATYISDEDGGTLMEIPDRKVLVRSDNNAYLATVSEGYKVVHPGEVLDFYADIVTRAGFAIETAGALRGGRKYWALASIGEQARIMGQDEIKGYVLLATSCDGSLATTGMFTSVRVVCANTLGFAVQEGESGGARQYIKVPHSRQFDPEAMKAELGLAHESWAAYVERVNALAKRKVNRKEALAWLIQAFGDADKPVEEQEENSSRVMKRVMELFDGAGAGADLRSAKGTAWGLVNAATQFLDHERRTHTRDARLDRAWFGDGAATKVKAWDAALALAA